MTEQNFKEIQKELVDLRYARCLGWAISRIRDYDRAEQLGKDILDKIELPIDTMSDKEIEASCNESINALILKLCENNFKYRYASDLQCYYKAELDNIENDKIDAILNMCATAIMSGATFLPEHYNCLLVSYKSGGYNLVNPLQDVYEENAEINITTLVVFLAQRGYDPYLCLKAKVKEMQSQQDFGAYTYEEALALARMHFACDKGVSCVKSVPDKCWHFALESKSNKENDKEIFIVNVRKKIDYNKLRIKGK